MPSMDRYTFAISSSLTFVAAAIFAIAIPTYAQEQNAQSPSFEIQYTGKLFGYYRIEADEQKSLEAVADFQKATTPKRGSGTVPLLGMGDNFAPEFGASIQQEFRDLGKSGSSSPCTAPVNVSPTDESDMSHKNAAPEILYKSSKRMPAAADCDNVTLFLMMAGYRAIVPGREDFIYSANWLRRIAILLRAASYGTDETLPNIFLDGPHTQYAVGQIQNTENKLFMLASNIRVNVIDKSAAKKDPKNMGSCPLLFAYNLMDPNPCSPDDKTISANMDWFQRLEETVNARTLQDSVDIKNSYAIEDALNRRASGDAEYREQLVANEFTILDQLMTAYKCGEGTATANSSESGQQNGAGSTHTLQQMEIKPFTMDESYVTNEERGMLKLKSGSEADSYLKELKGAALNVSCKGSSFDEIEPKADFENFASMEKVQQKIAKIAGAAVNSLEMALETDPAHPQGAILVNKKMREDARDLFLKLIYIEQRNTGYTIAKIGDNKRALIIGVAGKETMQQISPTNFSLDPDIQDKAPQPDSSDDNSKTAKPPAAATDKSSKPSGDEKAYDLQVGDPRFAVTAVLRAAWQARCEAKGDHKSASWFDYVIVMAQMPPAEAVELGARVRSDMEAAFPHEAPADIPVIDLILSESQLDRETKNRVMAVNPGDVPPVLTPKDGSVMSGGKMAEVISTADVYDGSLALTLNVESKPTLTRVIVNQTSGDDADESQTQGSEALTGSSSAQLVQVAGPENRECDAVKNPDHLPQNTACLLKVELDKVKLAPNKKWKQGEKTDLDALWDACEINVEGGKIYADPSCQNNVLMQQVLHLLERKARGDVVFLERRDFYFGSVQRGYGDYKICETWLADHPFANPKMRDDYEQYCRLRVALDRVLWKGDYMQRVMVDGTTLAGLLQTAAQQTDADETLLARDVRDAWLTSYGVVTEPATNLVRSTSSAYSFSVPGIKLCNIPSGPTQAADPSKPTGPTYCVDGQPIQTDHAYSLITSDHLAGDNSVYTALGAFTKSNADYETHLKPKPFITAEIADQAMEEGLASVLTAKVKAPGDNNVYPIPPETNLASVETQHQNRSLVQLDFSKLVAGFTFYHPSLTDAELASDLSGVANTQATTPHSQELDLESASRLTFSLPVANHPDSSSLSKALTFGLQNDAEYDRKVLGNLTGNPETVTYSLNSYTAGGFMQFPVDSRIAPHPHAFVVFAPYQYQRQMTGAYLNFAFLSAAGVANPQQQLSVHEPSAWGFNQRVGFRYQVESKKKWSPDTGSYGEVGPEYGDQNNILTALMMPQISPTAECSFIATQSVQSCVKSAYKAAGIALNGASILVPVPETLHAGGIYWTMHLQKQLNAKKSTVTFDTQGDYFLWPGATLTTQERYGITTNLALNYPIIGNITLSPTFSDFFFENQGAPSQRTNLMAPTFTVVLKWYFVRDAAVPFRKEFLFSGPATASQTATSKLKTQ